MHKQLHISILSFLFVSLFFITSCVKEVNYLQLKEQDGVLIDTLSKKPFTGISQLKDKKGRMIISAEYNEGIKDGTFQRYFRDGALNIEAEYDQGKKLYSIQYYKTGRKQRAAFLMDSIYISGEWNELGELIFIREELVDSIAHGRMIMLNEYKKVQSVIHYKNGLKEGQFVILHDNGKVNIKGEYVNDLQNNTWRLFNETGKILAIEKYNLGKRTGIWSYYFETGVKKAEIEFNENKIIRKTEYSEKGERIDEFTRE